MDTGVGLDANLNLSLEEQAQLSEEAAQLGKEWEVAGIIAKICRAYEANGRNKANIYIEGRGLPGTPGTVTGHTTKRHSLASKESLGHPS